MKNKISKAIEPYKESINFLRDFIKSIPDDSRKSYPMQRLKKANDAYEEYLNGRGSDVIKFEYEYSVDDEIKRSVDEVNIRDLKTLLLNIEIARLILGFIVSDSERFSFLSLKEAILGDPKNTRLPPGCELLQVKIKGLDNPKVYSGDNNIVLFYKDVFDRLYKNCELKSLELSDYNVENKTLLDTAWSQAMAWSFTHWLEKQFAGLKKSNYGIDMLILALLNGVLNEKNYRSPTGGSPYNTGDSFMKFNFYGRPMTCQILGFKQENWHGDHDGFSRREISPDEVGGHHKKRAGSRDFHFNLIYFILAANWIERIRINNFEINHEFSMKFKSTSNNRMKIHEKIAPAMHSLGDFLIAEHGLDSEESKKRKKNERLMNTSSRSEWIDDSSIQTLLTVVIINPNDQSMLEENVFCKMKIPWDSFYETSKLPLWFDVCILVREREQWHALDFDLATLEDSCDQCEHLDLVLPGDFSGTFDLTALRRKIVDSDSSHWVYEAEENSFLLAGCIILD